MDTHTPLLELTDARVVRDGTTILHIDSLRIGRGERIAVLGPNGSGKSTLIGLLTRDIHPIAVEPGTTPPVLMLGMERIDLLEARSMLGVVSFALQETYDLAVPVIDTVLSGYFGSVGLYRHQHPTEAMFEHAEELLETLGVAHLRDRLMSTLSTGEARRAIIARALVHDPEVLVLDEPCAGLDPGSAYHVRRAVSGLARAGHGLVLVTHHVDDIVPEIDRVVMLREGRVYRDGPIGSTLTDAALTELFGAPASLEMRDGWRRMW